MGEKHNYKTEQQCYATDSFCNVKIAFLDHRGFKWRKVRYVLSSNMCQWFLVHDQRDAQIIFYVFVSIVTLYIFRAHRAHHQERQIVSIQPLVTVILCWWPRCVQVGFLPTCTQCGHHHRMTVTRGCIDTICLS